MMRIINQSGQDIEVSIIFGSDTEKPQHYLMKGQTTKDVEDDIVVLELNPNVNMDNWNKRKKEFPDSFIEVKE